MPFDRIDDDERGCTAVSRSGKRHVHGIVVGTSLCEHIGSTAHGHIGIPQTHNRIVIAVIDVDTDGTRTVNRSRADNTKCVVAAEIIGLHLEISPRNRRLFVLSDIDVDIRKFSGHVHKHAARTGS